MRWSAFRSAEITPPIFPKGILLDEIQILTVHRTPSAVHGYFATFASGNPFVKRSKQTSMVFNLSDKNSVANRFVAELRDVQVQQDRLRFRRNLERLGEVLAYEITKKLPYAAQDVETPLGTARVKLPAGRIVLATILRAGLPMHQGMLNYLDQAENAFVSAYRRHHKDGSFDIAVEYVSCPDLNDAALILCDPMLATGASVEVALRSLLRHGQPSQLHVATAIASRQGLEHVRRTLPQASIWMGALDEELTAKSYIVPGLGDAGDLAYGPKLQG
jgi:uracil phosphoribosyltransferase